VLWQGRAWVIDRASFDGRPTLNVVRHEDGYRGALRNAMFGATELSADLEFQVGRDSSGDWTMSLRIPALRTAAEMKLENWLGGEPLVLTGAVSDLFRSGRSAKPFCVIGAIRSLDHQWLAQFSVGAELRMGAKRFSSNEMVARLCSHEPGVRCEIATHAAKRLDDGPWIVTKRPLSARSSLAGASLRVRFRALTGKSSSLVVEPEVESDRIAVEIATAGRGRGRIEVENYRFAEFVDRRRTKRTLVGDIAASGSHLVAGGLRVEMSGIGSSAKFVAEACGARLTHLHCEPSAIASNVQVDNALSAVFPLSQPHLIRFTGGDQPNKLVQLAQARPPSVGMVDFLSSGQGSGTVTGHVVCSGCAIEGKPHDIRYFSTHVARAEDLLWLGFEFYNFELKNDKKGRRYLAPLKVPGPAMVVVHFPPQHILENAYNEDLGCTPNPPKIDFPLNARLSGPSRLVFELPRDQDRLYLSLDALTDWRRWTIKKVPDARHTRLIRAPQWNETAVEAPSRLFSQPADATHWRAKTFEGLGQKRYVLFHTELIPDDPFDPREADGVRRARFVPMWTPDFVETGVLVPKEPLKFRDFLRLRSRLFGLEGVPDEKECKSGCALPPPRDDLLPGQSDPLSEGDRREIVRLSHDVTVCATPPSARYLLLTARGAFADIEGMWPQTRAIAAANINLEKWKQIIADGQDQKITIERRYLCYPFGHRLIYVKDTNRKIHVQGDAFYAVEKTTYRLVIRQRTVEYGRMRVQNTQDDRSFQLPFRSLTIADRIVPNLDEPAPLSNLRSDPPCLDAFWPTRCDKLLELNFEGIDWIGNTVTFAAPVLLVQDTVTSDDVSYIQAEYTSPSVVPAKDGNPRRRDFGGQLVALAPSYQKGDTEVDALRLDFDGVAQDLKYEFCPVDGSDRCEVLDYSERELSAPFYPVVYAVEARLPTLGRIATSGGGELWFEITDPEQENDPLEIFAVKHSANGYDAAGFALAFDEESDRSGGIAAPTPNIDALSRLKGPVGLQTLARAVRSRLQRSGGLTIASLGGAALPTPDTFFSALNAKILGVLPIKDLLRELGIDVSMPELLSFLAVGGDKPNTTGYVYNWDTDKLKNWPDGELGFQFKNTLRDGGPGSRLGIRAGAQLKLTEGAKPVGFISGALTNFRLRLVFIGNGIEAPFPSVRFHAPLGEKVKFDVELGDIKFVGPLMEFAAALKEFLGLGDGFDIDVRFDSLTASIGPFALPSIGFGVFSLSNIGFTASCRIYFRGNRPLAFAFGFASRDKPFALAVAFLAGRGHFLFEVDASGIQRIEASLEFGAYAELSFGVAGGYLYVMGGIFYASAKVPALVPNSSAAIFQTQITVEIYVRFGGALTALGFITISVDVHLGLLVSKRGSQTYAEGRATCTYSIKIGFFKKSFSVTFSRSLAGSNTDESQSAQGSLLMPGASSFAAQLPGSDAVSERERGACQSASCVNAITRPNFRTYWYAFAGGMAA
jgi:hypothetical protein